MLSLVSPSACDIAAVASLSPATSSIADSLSADKFCCSNIWTLCKVNNLFTPPSNSLFVILPAVLA